VSYKDITEHVGRILADPDTPVDLHNAISETVLEIADEHRVNIFHPAVMSVALPLALELQRATEQADAPTPPKAEDLAPFQRYADIIADLLEDDSTPEVLRSTLNEFCTELANQVAEGGECVCSPETTRKHLPSILPRAEARGVRCSSGGIMFERGGEPS
jgi:hypothetical protein